MPDTPDPAAVIAANPTPRPAVDPLALMSDLVAKFRAWQDCHGSTLAAEEALMAAHSAEDSAHSAADESASAVEAYIASARAAVG